MGIEKISVSVSSEDLAWAKKRAKRLRKSLSAIVSQALQRERKLDAGWQLLAELGTEDITEAHLKAMRIELGWEDPPSKPVRSVPGSSTRRMRARRK